MGTICPDTLLPAVTNFIPPFNKQLSSSNQVPGIWYVAKRNTKKMLNTVSDLREFHVWLWRKTQFCEAAKLQCITVCNGTNRGHFYHSREFYKTALCHIQFIARSAREKWRTQGEKGAQLKTQKAYIKGQ